MGVKIAAAIISLVILIAALYKYWISNYFSNGGQTVVSSSVTGTGGDVVVQDQPPTLNNEYDRLCLSLGLIMTNIPCMYIIFSSCT